MFPYIRCRDTLAVHRAQVVPVCPYCANLFGYGNYRYDTAAMVLRHMHAGHILWEFKPVLMSRPHRDNGGCIWYPPEAKNLFHPILSRACLGTTKPRTV